MPEYNVTVKDVSPLIVYSDGWREGSSADASLSMYSGGRFHGTPVPGASATLNFYGTACYFFGAKRANHQHFTVTLDNTSTSHSGYSNPDQFQQNLFSMTDLELGNHTLTITNGDVNDQWVDIDYLVFTTGDGNSDSASNSTFDDTDSSKISYSGRWSLQNNTIQSAQYHNGTYHSAKGKQATATINFEGNAAYVFGGTNTGTGLYSVVVDNGPPISLNGTTQIQQNFQVLLYYTGTLPSGKHNIVMTNLQDNLELDLDSVSVVSFADSPVPSQNPHGKSKIPVIAGAASGACIALLWIMGLVWFYLGRKKRRRQTSAGLLDQVSDHEEYIAPSDQPVMNSTVHPFGYRQSIGDNNQAIFMQPMRTKRGAVATQNTVRYTDNPKNTSIPSHTPLSSASGSRSENPSSASDPQGLDVERRRLPTLPRTVSYDGSEGQGNDQNNLNANANPPFVASSSSDIRLPIASSRQQELAASRMIVPDRPQDWGPISEADLERLTLPPNYQQATQPFQIPTPPRSNPGE